MRKSIPPRLLAVFLVFGVPSTSCKTARSDVDSVQTDGISKLAPPGMMRLVVASDQIERVVEPATAKDGLPATMHGIWWGDTDDYSFNAVISFHGSYYDKTSRTASLLKQGVGQVSQGEMPEDGKPGDIGFERDDRSFVRYDLVFAEDGKSARSYSRYGEDEPAAGEEPAYTMQLQADDDWLVTPTSSWIKPFHYRRIVKPDGTRDAAYADYLKKFSKAVAVIKAALVADLGDPGLDLDLQAGRGTYVQIVGSDQLRPAPYLITIDHDGADPLEIATKGDDDDKLSARTIDGKHLTVMASFQSPTFIYVKSKSGGKARLSFVATVANQITDQIQPVKVALTAGRTSYLNAKVPVNKAGLYEISAEGGAVAAMFSNKAAKFYEGKFRALVSREGTPIFLHPKGQDGEVVVTMRKLEIIAKDRGKVTMSTPPKGKLDNTLTVDFYQLELPKVAEPDVRFLLTRIAPGEAQGCCVGITSGQSSGQDVRFKLNERFSFSSSPQYFPPADARIYFGYSGDPNDVGSDLSYDYAAIPLFGEDELRPCQSNGGLGFGDGKPCATGLTCGSEDAADPSTMCVRLKLR